MRGMGTFEINKAMQTRKLNKKGFADFKRKGGREGVQGASTRFRRGGDMAAVATELRF